MNHIDAKIRGKIFHTLLNPISKQPLTTEQALRRLDILGFTIDDKPIKFIVKWLKENMTKNNEWDMGKEAKDGILFPLSDYWKTEENRIKDYTYRIRKLLERGLGKSILFSMVKC